MRNPWAEEFERDFQTPACLRGAHEACPHRVDGFGGGFNPRRLRLEFGTGLCACTCHAACPIADGRRAVPPRTWQESCTCPGAANERRRLADAGIEFPDLGQLYAEKRHRSQLRREAGQAVRAAAAGRSSGEIRQLLITELEARGLDVPPDRILDANVQAIMGNHGPSAREAGRAFAGMAEAAADIVRMFRGPGAGQPPDR